LSDIRLEGDFEKYLLSSYQILEKDLYRLIDDLTGTFNDSVEMFVQKRHFSLQKEGKRNKEIYTILQDGRLHHVWNCWLHRSKKSCISINAGTKAARVSWIRLIRN